MAFMVMVYVVMAQVSLMIGLDAADDFELSSQLHCQAVPIGDPRSGQPLIADIVMAYVVMAQVMSKGHARSGQPLMAYIVMAYVVMAQVVPKGHARSGQRVMAYIVMAYIVMAQVVPKGDAWSGQQDGCCCGWDRRATACPIRQWILWYQSMRHRHRHNSIGYGCIGHNSIGHGP